MRLEESVVQVWYKRGTKRGTKHGTKEYFIQICIKELINHSLHFQPLLWRSNTSFLIRLPHLSHSTNLFLFFLPGISPSLPFFFFFCFSSKPNYFLTKFNFSRASFSASSISLSWLCPIALSPLRRWVRINYPSLSY